MGDDARTADTAAARTRAGADCADEWRVGAMRETKFRGRRTDKGHEGQWVYGNYVATPVTKEGSLLALRWSFFGRKPPTHCIEADGLLIAVDPDTVGQWTGLQDSRGVQIYEGDVLTVDGIDGTNSWVTCWNENAAGFEFEPIGHPYSWVHNMLLENGDIVGNIYEHPELLKGGDGQ